MAKRKLDRESEIKTAHNKRFATSGGDSAAGNKVEN